jgi:type IV secretory pathway VirB10-like protein
VPEKGAPGDFDYPREATDERDEVDQVDEGNTYAPETDLDYLLADDQSDRRDGFDAFDENTWDEDFTPVVAVPWYRVRQSRVLLVASAVAVSAIVISVSLLVFRQPTTSDESTPVDTTTAVTTPLATATSEPPPPPPPAPPPPPPPPPLLAPSAVNQAPAVIRPSVRPRQTKEPEIGVTRTPATRQPISVAPQPRGPRQ